MGVSRYTYMDCFDLEDRHFQDGTFKEVVEYAEEKVAQYSDNYVVARVDESKVQIGFLLSAPDLWDLYDKVTELASDLIGYVWYEADKCKVKNDS